LSPNSGGLPAYMKPKAVHPVGGLPGGVKNQGLHVLLKGTPIGAVCSSGMDWIGNVWIGHD
jgi:hypothetical protein